MEMWFIRGPEENWTRRRASELDLKHKTKAYSPYVLGAIEIFSTRTLHDIGIMRK